MDRENRSLTWEEVSYLLTGSFKLNLGLPGIPGMTVLRNFGTSSLIQAAGLRVLGVMEAKWQSGVAGMLKSHLHLLSCVTWYKLLTS